MKYIMFTKHLEGLDVTGIMDALKSVGVEGADLCVRPGYPVNPENADTQLPVAAKRFADEGLSIPLVTTPTSFWTRKIPMCNGYTRHVGRPVSLTSRSAIGTGRRTMAGIGHRSIASAKPSTDFKISPRNTASAPVCTIIRGHRWG